MSIKPLLNLMVYNEYHYIFWHDILFRNIDKNSNNNNFNIHINHFTVNDNSRSIIMDSELHHYFLKLNSLFLTLVIN